MEEEFMTPRDVVTALTSMVTRAGRIWYQDACGVTRSETAIPALVHMDAYTPVTPRRRVLLIGGLSGHADDAALTLQALEAYLHADSTVADRIALSAVPVGNMDGLATGAAPGNGAGGQPGTGYPPVGAFYDDAQNPERRYLWRWIGMQAPDVVVELRAGATASWESSDAASSLGIALRASPFTAQDQLPAAFATGIPNQLGIIPGLCLTTPPEALTSQLERLWSALALTADVPASPARRALDTRRARTPLQIARTLARTYGYTLDPVVYTQGMAISGRLQLHRLDPTSPNPIDDLTRLAEPFVSGTRSLDDRVGTSTLGGLIWGIDLADTTGDQRYADLLIQTANRYQAGVDGGAPPPSDPTFRTEDMAMNSMLLGRAYERTGASRYLELMTPFLLSANIQQADGLFWHCRTAPYYWGRGNGFAALGYCEALSYLPDDHPDREPLLAIHQHHIEAMLACQHSSGMLREVLNVPGSYQEFTVTCMLAYAMARGMRRGWFDSRYQAALELAWQGITERIDESGGIVDACTNTGVQEDLRAYLDRPAVFGRDDRSGSFALWLALELAQLRGEV
jgi:rhamnogalacturonyl hydrolase YesR